ncbi:hypothetical protein WJX77_005151 [Trebouxia sp. C0004]
MSFDCFVAALPLPVLQLIFSHVLEQQGSSVGLCLVSAVCKSWSEAVQSDPSWQHINIPKTQADCFDDYSLKHLALKAKNQLQSIKLHACRRLSTFCILEVLLNSKQLKQVSIISCPQMACYNFKYYLEAVLKQPRHHRHLEQLCFTNTHNTYSDRACKGLAEQEGIKVMLLSHGHAV